jgi:predicted dehydrogenase
MRIAILGCGSIGRRHLNNLRHLGCTNLVAYDPAPQARQAVERDFGVCCLATAEAIWETQPQAVLIAAPSDLHTELALSAAQHGCDLFIEKPLAYTVANLDQLQAEVVARGLVTMVGCNMRFHPGPAAIKKLIDTGSIGQVIAARIQTGSYLPRWRPAQDYRQSYSASLEWGGATLDCIHEIDLALWYAGPAALVAAVSLPAATIGLETDGLAEIILRHANGVISSVHLNFIQRDYRRTAQIIGSEGTISWDFAERRVLVYGPDGQIAQTIAEPAGWELNQMYIGEIDHFLQAISARRPTINPLAGGIAALEIALAARQAKG